MSGVEAAASLFGSEDSNSDLFLSLGIDDNPKVPTDDLYSGDTQATSGQVTNIPDISNQESFSANSTLYSKSNYSPEIQAVGNGYNSYGYTQSTFAGQDDPNHLGALLTSYGYVFPKEFIAASRRAASMTECLPNIYTPQSYVSPVASVKKPPSVSNSPQPYAALSSHPSYTPYTPPALSTFSSTAPSNGPPQPVYGSSAGSTTRVGAVSSAPQPPPPISSANARPKISNAYDPPFLPSKPNRRNGRATNAQQAYNIYQSSNTSAWYPSSTGATTIHSVGYFRGLPPTQEEHGPAVMEGTDVHNYSEISPIGPSSLSSNSFDLDLNTAHHTGTFSHATETVTVRKNHPEEVDFLATYFANGANEAHSAGRSSSLSGFMDQHSDLSHASTIGTSSGLMKSEQLSGSFTGTINTSPSKVPLPHSPNQMVESSPENSVLQGSSTRPLFHRGQYTPPKKEAVATDQYAPIRPCATNHVPRSTSPLQSGYLLNQPYKVPPALSLDDDLYTYKSVSPTTTVPTLPHSLDVVSPAIHDCLSPRHAFNSTRDIGDKSFLNQYAPSPSLVGANDPLSRTSAQAPVVSFGFGGKLVTCFHGMPGLNAGFDIALSTRTSSELKVRVLHKILPESALNSPGHLYPGPLLSDPGTPSLSLVKPGASTQAKTKKSGVLTYLSSKVNEINQGLGYLAAVERQAAENKLVLVKVLKALVENDGRLLGM